MGPPEGFSQKQNKNENKRKGLKSKSKFEGCPANQTKTLFVQNAIYVAIYHRIFNTSPSLLTFPSPVPPDHIEDHIEQTLGQTKAGVVEVKKAMKQQKKSRKWMCCLLFFVTGLVGMPPSSVGGFAKNQRIDAPNETEVQNIVVYFLHCLVLVFPVKD